MLATPFPYIANQAGWMVAEVGRQPWIVYGLQRTAAATSTNVSGGMTWFTLLGFMGLYALPRPALPVPRRRIVEPGRRDTATAPWLGDADGGASHD